MDGETIRRALVGRGSVFVIGRSAIVVVQIIALPFVTRALSPEEFGEVALAFLLSSLVSSIGDAGIPIAASRVFFDGERGPETSRLLVGVALVLGVLAAAVMDATSGLWMRVFDQLEYDQVIRLGVWLTAPAMARNASMNVLKAQDRPIAHSSIALVSEAGGQSMGLLALLFLHTGPVGYVGGVTIGVTLAAGLGWIQVGGRLPWIAGRPGLRSILPFSLPTVPRQASRSLLNNGDRVIIERMAGLGDVGRYQIGYRLGSLPMIVTNEMSSALVPIVFRQETDARATIRAIQAVAFRLAASMAFGLALTAPLFVKLIAPDSYEPESLASVVALVGAAAIPHAFSSVANLGLLRVKRTRPLARVSLLAAAVNLGSAIAGMAAFGLVGVAGATVLAFGLEAVLLQGALWRHVGVEALDRRARAVVLMAVLGCCAVAAIPTSGWVWLVVRGFGTVVAGLSLLRTVLGR